MGRSLFTNVCQTLSNWGSRLYGAQPHDETMQVKVSGKAAWGGCPKSAKLSGIRVTGIRIHAILGGRHAIFFLKLLDKVG